jgi:hypothetical protein
MSILGLMFKGKSQMTTEEEKPEFKQFKKYRLCTEDNPNERKYRCGKNDICSPSCKLSLYLEGLTTEQMKEIELELTNMLERNAFEVR